MATTRSLRHPSHKHPLVQLDSRLQQFARHCRLCHRKIWTKAYTCQEGCLDYYYHEACVEAPHQIKRHPLHPVHLLTLVHGRPSFICDACSEGFSSGSSSFWCNECDFDLDICCALSTLLDVVGYQGDKASEQITLWLHPHPLTSLSTRHDFVRDRDCYICRGRIEGDGYTCLRPPCEFFIHKRCIQDQYYADGTKAPRVYHIHPLANFVREDSCSTRCSSCGSDKSGEFIGCYCGQVFYHRQCFQVPEFLRYPSHNPGHTLVLFLDVGPRRRCQSCSSSLEDEIYYRCTSCEFFVHIGCAIRTIGYYEDGMSPEIELAWHEHTMLLCHRAKPFFDSCPCCEGKFDGPAYVCGEKNCQLMLHKQCTELVPKIDHHPHHPEHPLALLAEVSIGFKQCDACRSTITGFRFTCKLCEFYLHVKCISRFPTRKHYLHEHDLVQFEEILSAECNRCRTADNSPLFRCVPCNFNLHERCMELPLVVKHDTHVHELTLRDFYMEDNSGEYYCDLCGERRDGRLGVYVCEICRVTWAFQIECVLPELRKVYAKKSQSSAVKRFDERIARKNEEVRSIEEKLDDAKRELDELVKRRAELISGEEKNYAAATETC